jgi:hypothetical protein
LRTLSSHDLFITTSASVHRLRKFVGGELMRRKADSSAERPYGQIGGGFMDGAGVVYNFELPTEKGSEIEHPPIVRPLFAEDSSSVKVYAYRTSGRQVP